MKRKVRDSVVVITGASSGIGRATALAFARRGATVVLAARREQPLQELADQCQRLGTYALAVPTDVTDEQAVQSLARTAIEQFGHIDVWVNNAGVSLFARFEEAPSDAYRRVIETNLFGTIHGARAALPYFREQGSGVLINMSSVFGTIGAPYLSAYITTKFGIRGLSESLRQEVRDVKHIHVSTIMPASIDTPIFQHAANFTGRTIKPLNPVSSAEEVANAIVACAEHPRREVIVGKSGHRLVILRRLLPALTEWQAAAQVEHDHFTDQPASTSAGNLFSTHDTWTGISGEWPITSRQSAIPAIAAGLTSLTLGAAGWYWLQSRRPETLQWLGKRIPMNVIQRTKPTRKRTTFQRIRKYIPGAVVRTAAPAVTIAALRWLQKRLPAVFGMPPVEHPSAFQRVRAQASRLVTHHSGPTKTPSPLERIRHQAMHLFARPPAPTRQLPVSQRLWQHLQPVLPTRYIAFDQRPSLRWLWERVPGVASKEERSDKHTSAFQRLRKQVEALV